MSLVVKLVALGESLYDLARDQSQWSQKTFGSDAERGPIGALKHLAKEAGEAEAACRTFNHHATMLDTVAANAAELNVREEMADCLLLILDASRRAGITPLELLTAAQAKMEINKARAWPKTVGDVPTEHVRGEG